MSREYKYEIKSDKPLEPVFIDLSELTPEEREVIVKMSDDWVYGKQVVLQSEFVRKLSPKE